MTTLAPAAREQAQLLRRAIQADAVASAVASLTALVAAAPIEAATGIPAALLQPLGAVFLLYAGGLAYLSARPTISTTLARGAIALNGAWIVASIAALIFGWLPLTPAGFWVVAAQALLLDLITVAQYLGLRQAR